MEDIIADITKKSAVCVAPTSSKVTKIDSKLTPAPTGIVKVTINDSLTIATLLTGKGFKVSVLNFANGDRPCAGYKMSGNTQEEDIFRRTNIMSTLVADLYPFGSAVVTSPDVTIFKDRHGKDLQTPVKVNIISAAALVCPKQMAIRDQLYLTTGQTDKYDFANQTDIDTTTDCVRLILAEAERSEVLITGAWGCGVFCNPEYGLIKIWNAQLAKLGPKYTVFAIPTGGTNHQIFKKYILQNI